MRKLVTLFFFLFISISLSQNVYADEPPPPPVPYKVEIDNGNYVLFMTPRGEESDDFLMSGLYQCDNLAEPIYVIDNYIYQDELFLSSDGKHYVHIKWWLSLNSQNAEGSDTSEPAISLYKNGILQSTFYISDLINNKKNCVYSVSHVQWDIQTERLLDLESDIFSVQTRENKTISFDIITGTIIEEKQTTLYVIIVGICLVFIALSFASIFLRRHKRNKV